MDKTNIFIARFALYYSFPLPVLCCSLFSSFPHRSYHHNHITIYWFLWQSTIANKLLWCSIVFAVSNIITIVIIISIMRGYQRTHKQIHIGAIESALVAVCNLHCKSFIFSCWCWTIKQRVHFVKKTVVMLCGQYKRSYVIWFVLNI